jgi:hypothetical protein
MVGPLVLGSSRRRAPFWRLVGVGSICFALGSLALAHAYGESPDREVAIADGQNRFLRAHIDDAGSLSVVSQGTSQVSGQVSVENFPATQAVSGTVTVANLPGTQNVNITGGAITSAPTVADQGGCWGFAGPFGCGGVGVMNVPSGTQGSCAPSPAAPLNITGYSFIESGGTLTISFQNSATQSHWNFQMNNGNATQTFAFPVKADTCTYDCENGTCVVDATIVGFN